MPDFLEMTIIGQNNLTRNLDQLPDVVQALLVEKAHGWVDMVYDQVMENIHERLGSKSGNLELAVHSEVDEEGGMIQARVWIDQDQAPYARALEKGATIPAHIIRPREGKVLAFMAASGDKVFASRVFHPGAQIKPHYFMRDAKRSTSARIAADVKKTIVRGIRASMRNTK